MKLNVKHVYWRPGSQHRGDAHRGDTHDSDRTAYTDSTLHDDSVTDPRTTTYSEFAILIPCRTDDPDRIPRLYHDSSPRCSSLAAAPRHSDGCHLPPSPCGTPSTSHFQPIRSLHPRSSVCIRQLQAVSVSRAAAMGLDLDLRTVALLVVGPHTPHHMTASRHPRHAGTPQFTRDWTRNPSGV